MLGASIPNDRFVEIAAAALVLVGLNAFLRYTRYGLIIRAGVENRAMVTALGIDVRKAFTLVFALGGAAAALAGVLSGVYYGVVDPEPRHVAPDLRLHRRRHRRLRLDRRHRRRGGRGRADPAVRELLRVERARRPRRRAPARDRAPAQARGARSEGGPLTPRPAAPGARRCCSRASRVLPLLSLDIPVIFGGPLDSPGTLGLLALCLVFAGVALTYDLLFGFTGPALVRARALLRDRRLPDDDRADEVGVGLRPVAARRRGCGDPRAARARRDQPPRRRDRLRDGDARLRAGRARCSCRRTRTG